MLTYPDIRHTPRVAAFFHFIISGPYRVRGLVFFGSDPLIAQGDAGRGKEALKATEFYVHVDMVANPTAAFADILLPAATPWETEALKTNFSPGKGGNAETARWAQMRKAVVLPPPGVRSDLAIIFDLAGRLGLGAQFFNGDIEAAWRHQLEPSGLTLEALHASPIGLAAKVETRHRKYTGTDPETKRPRGFPTPTRRIALYSTRFAIDPISGSVPHRSEMRRIEKSA